MLSHRLMSAIVAAAMVSMASAATTITTVKPIPSPTQTLPANALVSKGCFSTPTPLVDYGPYLYQSEGNCQQICLGLAKPVMALSDGSNCWCGDLLPPANAKVADSQCNTTCGGGAENFCGGNKHYFVELTGQTRNNIENFVPEVSSSSTTSAPKQTSNVAQTAQATATIPPKSTSDGPNKAGIAAGVVVGVLALAGIIAGVYFFLRRQRRRELEEEHRRQAAVNSFVSGGKLHTSNSSMTDSRLDPNFMNRRQSNGSIADNEDYSRRILKVTNA